MVDLSKIFEIDGETSVVEGSVDLAPLTFYGGHPFTENIPVKIEAENRAGVVTLNLTATFTLKLSCDRCLDEFERLFVVKTSHIAVREIYGEDNEQFVLCPDGILDLGLLATTDIVLEMPYGKLCKDDCKGLCSQCGQNKNKTSCNCEEPQVASPWAALDMI